MTYLALIYSWFCRLLRLPFSKSGVKKRPKKKPKPRVRRESLSGLLDELDEVGRLLECKTFFAMNTRDTRKALRRLGPHVIPKESLANVSRITDPSALSTLVFVGMDTLSETPSVDRLPSVFSYAVKTKLEGLLLARPKHKSIAAYECGQCVYDKKSNKVAWCAFYVSVDKDGYVEPLNRRLSERVYLKNGGSFRRVVWKPIDLYPPEIKDMAVNDWCIMGFCAAMNFWSKRREYWSVSVKKKEQRVTFSVHAKDAPHYFSDRDKIATTPTGKRKTILHYVTAHDRTLSDGRFTLVKPHLRGAKDFLWNAFRCSITAPGFHSYTTDSFDAAPDIFMDDELPEEPTVTMPELASMLASTEDKQTYTKQENHV